MKIKSILIALATFCFMPTIALYAQDSQPGTWVFSPDSKKISQEAILDLSFLNEDVAGEKGWMTARDGEMYLPGSDRPFRGWSAGLRPFGFSYDMDELKQTARFYARLGFNQVREMTDANIDLLQLNADEDITKINLENLDKLHRLIAAMKEEGIYVTLCPWWFHRFKIENHPQVPGMVRHGKVFYWSRDLRDLTKEWYRQIFTTKNPYTGLSIAEDSAVNIFELHNEQNLFFYGLHPTYCDEDRWNDLGRQFTDWAANKYGSIEEAENAWGFNDKAREEFIHIVNGKRQLHAPRTNWWFDGFRNKWELKDGRFIEDSLAFITWLERDWVSEMTTFIKDELGYGGLVSGGNWRGANDALEDLSTYAKIADPAGVANYHVYVNYGMESPKSPRTASYKITKGSFYHSGSPLSNPLRLSTNYRHYRGAPMIATEMGYPFPNDRNLEGILPAAAYGSLTGLDQITWLQIQFLDYGEKVGWQNRFNYNWPHLLGQFPAASLIYRLGYVDQAEPVVIEHRPLNAAFAGQKPAITPLKSKDPLYQKPGSCGEDESSILLENASEDGIDPLAFAVGPVQFDFTQDERSEIIISEDELKKRINRDANTVQSRTGQLDLNWGRETLIINTPEAQGIVGRLAETGPAELSDITIECANPYASVIAVSLDGQPLKLSNRILIQAATPSQLTGYKAVTLDKPVEVEIKGSQKKVTVPAGAKRIDDLGKLPFVVDKVQSTVTFNTLRFSKATAVDLYGIVMTDTNVQMDMVNGKQQITLPDNTYFTILEK